MFEFLNEFSSIIDIVIVVILGVVVFIAGMSNADMYDVCHVDSSGLDTWSIIIGIFALCAAIIVGFPETAAFLPTMVLTGLRGLLILSLFIVAGLGTIMYIDCDDKDEVQGRAILNGGIVLLGLGYLGHKAYVAYKNRSQ